MTAHTNTPVDPDDYGSLICSVRGRILPRENFRPLGYAPYKIEQAPQLAPLFFYLPTTLENGTRASLNAALAAAAEDGSIVDVYGWAEAAGDSLMFYAVRVVRDGPSILPQGRPAAALETAVTAWSNR